MRHGENRNRSAHRLPRRRGRLPRLSRRRFGAVVICRMLDALLARLVGRLLRLSPVDPKPEER